MVRPEPQPAVDNSRQTRLVAAIVLVACLSVLLFANYLDSPAQAAAKSSRGEPVKALTSFGYPGCSFKSVTGLPCATCGMTRSFTFMADGAFADAFAMQPMGALLCLGLAMVVLLAGWSLLTAMPLGPVFGAVFRPKPIIAVVAFLIGVWVFTIIRTLAWTTA